MAISSRITIIRSQPSSQFAGSKKRLMGRANVMVIQSPCKPFSTKVSAIWNMEHMNGSPLLLELKQKQMKFPKVQLNHWNVFAAELSGKRLFSEHISTQQAPCIPPLYATIAFPPKVVLRFLSSTTTKRTQQSLLTNRRTSSCTSFRDMTDWIRCKYFRRTAKECNILLPLH